MCHNEPKYTETIFYKGIKTSIEYKEIKVQKTFSARTV